MATIPGFGDTGYCANNPFDVTCLKPDPTKLDLTPWGTDTGRGGAGFDPAFWGFGGGAAGAGTSYLSAAVLAEWVFLFMGIVIVAIAYDQSPKLGGWLLIVVVMGILLTGYGKGVI